MRVKSITNAKKITGKKILLRTDFNVPVKNAEVLDDFKILRGLPTIRFLLENNCRLIIISHLGRPKPAKTDNKYSLEPVAGKLSKLLFKPVKFVSGSFGFKTGTEVSKMRNGEVLMLENLRFEKGEENNDKIFAKELAGLADIYVNDAFANSHRNHASMSSVKNYLPAYAGLLLEEELKHFERILHPQEPLIAVIGGAKLETKIPLITKLIKKAHRILIGGAIANNFFLAHGLQVGQSHIDEKSINLTKSLINRPGRESNKIILPLDVIASSKALKWKPQIRKINKVGKDEYIFDIGPETIRLYAKFIKKANTLIWNGPMGMFEEEHYRAGTMSVGRLIAARSSGKAYGAVGGGETVEALKLTKMLEYIDWVSTGGGAMLSYLGGEKMPGLKGLITS